MPSVPVYIRKEDFKKWEAIDNKSQWLHDKLKGTVEPSTSVSKSSPASTPLKAGISPKPDTQFCKHNAVRGFCKKGCK